VHDAENPTVILLNARGDYLLNLPALRALSYLYGDKLKVVVRPGARRTFFPGLRARSFHEPELDFSKSLDERFDFEALARDIGACDLFLSLNPWHARSIDRLLERLAPARSIGYHPAFDVALPLDFTKHNIDLAFDLPRAIAPSLEVDSFAAPPALEEASETVAARIRASIPPSHRIAIVHAETKSEKMWPVDRFVAALDWLLDRYPDFVILDIGVKDMGLDRGRHGGRVVHCAGLPLAVAIALTRHANLFLGVDSCFLHAVDLFRVPGVGLFGSTDAHEFGFRFGPHRHVGGKVSMTDLEVEEVIAAIEDLLQEVNG
jgi:ADP-heptose:LPS heptosyltransferase